MAFMRELELRRENLLHDQHDLKRAVILDRKTGTVLQDLDTLATNGPFSARGTVVIQEPLPGSQLFKTRLVDIFIDSVVEWRYKKDPEGTIQICILSALKIRYILKSFTLGYKPYADALKIRLSAPKPDSRASQRVDVVGTLTEKWRDQADKQIEVLRADTSNEDGPKEDRSTLQSNQQSDEGLSAKMRSLEKRVLHSALYWAPGLPTNESQGRMLLQNPALVCKCAYCSSLMFVNDWEHEC